MYQSENQFLFVISLTLEISVFWILIKRQFVQVGH